MPSLTRAVTNAIELGVDLLGWYASSFSESPDDENAKLLVRVLLDNIGLGTVEVPDDRNARSRFITDVAMRLDAAGKKQLSDAVKLGWALGAYDETIQEQDPTALTRLIQLAADVGVAEQDVRQLTKERKSVHQQDQANILLAHIQRWRESCTATKGEPYIFLCHASEDKDSVSDINRQLSDQGYATWLDEQNLLPGQNWDMEIKKAIKKADVVLILLSTSSKGKRGYFQKEIKLALDVLQEVPDDEIFLIPAMLEKCDLPDRLQSRQAVRLYESGGFELLVRALDTQFRRE